MGRDVIALGGGNWYPAGLDAQNNYVGWYCPFSVLMQGQTATFTMQDGYLPTGDYRYVWLICEVGYGSGHCNNRVHANSYQHIDGNLPLSSQSLDTTFASANASFNGTTIGVCLIVESTTGTSFDMGGFSYCSGGGTQPIPPTPPIQQTCSINNGNDLSVNFGTIERETLPTVPGTGQPTHIQIPVECSGTGDSLSVNMQLQYTPITFGGIDLIQTSSNGVGVSVIYNDQVLSPKDITPLTLAIGSNTLDLDFEADHNPAVETGDIPTGSFTASAVLLMTQQ